MNTQRRMDFSIGCFMLLGLIAFFVLVIKVSDASLFSWSSNYQVTADFANVGGLKVRAPVSIAGVKVGEVTAISLQPGRLNAHVVMRLDSKIKIPYEDVSARILTEGLLGSNYISIVPGFDEESSDTNAKSHPYLREGDVIDKTQEAIVLENLIGQLLFSIKK